MPAKTASVRRAGDSRATRSTASRPRDHMEGLAMADGGTCPTRLATCTPPNRIRYEVQRSAHEAALAVFARNRAATAMQSRPCRHDDSATTVPPRPCRAWPPAPPRLRRGDCAAVTAPPVAPCAAGALGHVLLVLVGAPIGSEWLPPREEELSAKMCSAWEKNGVRMPSSLVGEVHPGCWWGCMRMARRDVTRKATEKHVN